MSSLALQNKELAIDAIFGTNNAGMELYSVVAKLDGTAVPLAYLVVEKCVSTGSNRSIEAMTQILYQFLRPLLIARFTPSTTDTLLGLPLPFLDFMLKLSNSSWYLTRNVSKTSNITKIGPPNAFWKVNSSFPFQRTRWLYLTAKSPQFLNQYESLIKARGICPKTIFMNRLISKICQSPEKNREAQDKQSSNKEHLRTVPTKKRSVRHEPSTGKPSFTDTYMQNSCEKIRRLEKPQHLLVILDLNGTLLYRPKRRKRPTQVIPRPHSFTFLRECSDKFAVAIWSSASPVNVRSICDKMLSPSVQNKILAVWARDKFDLSNRDYNLRVICYKRLTKLWDDKTISMSHPDYSRGARWDQTNTVLIDDSIEKARTEPYNLIRIPEFWGDPNEPGDILLQVYGFLNHVSTFSNVSAYLRQHPFTLSSNSDITIT
ncbi:hypothetical protein EPUL_004021 [Erysiphe pulchra]|uniref:Mitochondrial import inner membrane translocase subunit TIM50 n=1 Tax=Erysiphe pulchra TaxID=225359 RepID=A0A2S4PR55_9PEZI|nr:hypothetical protein EPUL_004021 [Erysiphe pulchra]